VVDERSYQLAAQTVLAANLPGTGSWSVLEVLYDGENRDAHVWSLQGPLSSREGRAQLGASTLFLTGFSGGLNGALTELGVLQVGEEINCWRLIDTSVVRPFPEVKKQWIHHSIRSKDALEEDVYNEVLIMAHQTTADAFRKAARTDLAYVHLFEEPERYCGEVVHIEGRLKRVQRFEPKPEATQAGVTDDYEGWIFDEIRGANPVCVHFTHLPAGIELNKSVEYHVAFDGYFFKKIRYQGSSPSNPKQLYDAPMLIGHTLTLRPAPPVPPESTTEWGHTLLFFFVVVVVGAILTVVGTALWFRRDDRRVRARVAAAGTRNVVLPDPQEGLPEPFFVNESEPPEQGTPTVVE
jgi:hypothetical protein